MATAFSGRRLTQAIVILPGEVGRHSTTFFCYPTPDTVLEVFPRFRELRMPPPPIMADTFLEERLLVNGQ